MKTIIPYEKEIKFDTKIAEITSISLEHEDKILDNEIMGDFIVSGDYKVHSISVNKEPFKYRLPFSIELGDNLIHDSITYDINDFTYDIKNNDTLIVKIEVSLEADEVEAENDEIAEQNINSSSSNDDETIVERNNSLTEDQELNSMIDNNISNDKNPVSLEDKPNSVEIEPEVNNSKDIIMNNVTNTANTYITYNIHLVENNDTIDSICNNFKVSKDLLAEYNDIHELKPGDKLLIPELKDE
jgi:hypothetical protein